MLRRWYLFLFRTINRSSKWKKFSNAQRKKKKSNEQIIYGQIHRWIGFCIIWWPFCHIHNVLRFLCESKCFIVVDFNSYIWIGLWITKKLKAATFVSCPKNWKSAWVCNLRPNSTRPELKHFMCVFNVCLFRYFNDSTYHTPYEVHVAVQWIQCDSIFYRLFLSSSSFLFLSVFCFLFLKFFILFHSSHIKNCSKNRGFI